MTTLYQIPTYFYVYLRVTIASMGDALNQILYFLTAFQTGRIVSHEVKSFLPPTRVYTIEHG